MQSQKFLKRTAASTPDKRINIALISENYFTKYFYITIPGYNLLNINHPDNTAHGGGAIYIKSSPVFSNSFKLLSTLFKVQCHLITSQ